MIIPETCRAGRALIDWTQHQLAIAANVGVSTVKNFETGISRPTNNNLMALQAALENAGVEFVSDDQGGPGVLARRFRIGAYIPGDGLHVTVKYVDLDLDAPDNDFELWF